MNPEFEIPLRSGEAFCFPPIVQWDALARDNAAALDRLAVPLAGVPLAEVRRQARPEVLTAAAAYAKALGLVAAAPGARNPLVVTGHQPTFFHPGIWLKHLVVDRVARETGGIGLSMSVDTDTPQEIGADVPRREGRELRLVHETLLRVDPDVASADPDDRRERLPATPPGPQRAKWDPQPLTDLAKREQGRGRSVRRCIHTG